jgi:hypothetical protein
MADSTTLRDCTPSLCHLTALAAAVSVANALFQSESAYCFPDAVFEPMARALAGSARRSARPRETGGKQGRLRPEYGAHAAPVIPGPEPGPADLGRRSPIGCAPLASQAAIFPVRALGPLDVLAAVLALQLGAGLPRTIAEWDKMRAAATAARKAKRAAGSSAVRHR